jgi:hypothetical protein
MGRSKKARQLQSAYKARANLSALTDEQDKLISEHKRSVSADRLSRIRLETKGDRSQRADRRDGIGMAPTVGAGRAENAGRLRQLSRSIIVDRTYLRSSFPTTLGRSIEIIESTRYQRITIASYQLIEIGRSPYLRLTAIGKTYLILLGTKQAIDPARLFWLESFLDPGQIQQLIAEWDVLLDRSSEY